MLSLAVGATLVALGWRKRWLALWIPGLVVLLTAPALGLSATAIWGHYPTIDKAGSLHFYGLGAHFSCFDLGAEATRLIGVSMGHLWVTQALDAATAWLDDRSLPGFAAMNLHGLLNLALGWYVAARLCEEAGAGREAAVVAGFSYGMGLHAFRDLNWYTIEKSGAAWLALYAWALLRAHKRGGGWIFAAAAAYLWAFFYNSYWGVLGAVLAGLALIVGNRHVWLAVGASALAGLPLVWTQIGGLANESLPQPAAFAERAALDVLTLWPPEWNRLELWRALDPVLVFSAAFGACNAWVGRRRRGTAESATDAGARPVAAVRDADAGEGGDDQHNQATKLRWLTAAILGLTVLALGPGTPLWTAFCALPGMWRFAKPETFFHLVVLGMAVLAATELGRRSNRAVRAAAVVQVALWFALVRMHEVYPAFSAVP
jgi:hypothetical protein